MASIENVVEAFEDLGFTIEDPKAVDLLVSLCDVFSIDEEKLSCEYLAYASQKKLTSVAPTLTVIEAFEKELERTLASTKASKAAIESLTATTVYDSATLPINDSSFGNSDLDDSALSFYGTPRGKTGQQKRQITPDNSVAKKRHAVAGLTGNTPVVFSPTSYKADTPRAVGKKYSARTNRGHVLIRFDGDPSLTVGAAHPASFWKSDANFVAGISLFNPSKPFVTKNYRYMFERLREKAGFLDETICRITDCLVSKHWSKEVLDGEAVEPMDFCHVMPEPFPASGRICCDAAEGRFNAKSIVLQGSQDICRGLTLPLDTSSVPEFSLFPGQVITTKVINPNGTKLVAHKIWSDASPMLPTTKIRLNTPSETMDLVIASGPFTVSTDLDYEPLKDLLDYVSMNKPQVLILCGPFVDEKHPLIEAGILAESFEAIFGRIMTAIAGTVQDLPTEVVIVPSQRDVHHHPTYPTPPFEQSKNSKKLHMVPDPCLLNIEGVIIGITTTDILFHLGKEEISFPPHSSDRLRRLANHLIQQQSFYPLYPPNEEVHLDIEQLELHGQLPVQPHLLVLPSDLLHFFKELNGCLVTNPQRLVKGEGGGVFARIKISGLKEVEQEKPFVHRVSAEIVRI